MNSIQPEHAFADDALGDSDATALASRIRCGEISAGEAVDAAIGRARKMNPVLNAIQFECFDQVREQAPVTIRRGFFAGVPSFIKDNLHQEGLPTNFGTRAFVAPPSRHSDIFVRQFLAQGFVSLGKTRLPEFGFSASTEFRDDPPTRNPWNPEYSSGASSGGAAALVAAGVVPIAHANDGGGSIRIPAACCGLVGLKPSRGRLPPQDAAKSMPIDIVVDGVVSRSVRDTANFLAGAALHHPGEGLPPVGLVEGPGARRLRVGVAYDSIVGKTDAETRKAVSDTVGLLEQLGHRVHEIALPIPLSFADDFGGYWGMLAFFVSLLGKKLFDPSFDAARLDNLSSGLARLYRRKMLKTPIMIHRLRAIERLYAGMFTGCDVVLSPVLGHCTPKLGHLSPTLDFETLFARLNEYASFTPLNNISGGPGISLPLGAAESGMPIGIHFSAAVGDERTLLELAFELEEARPWRRIQDIAATRSA